MDARQKRLFPISLRPIGGPGQKTYTAVEIAEAGAKASALAAAHTGAETGAEAGKSLAGAEAGKSLAGAEAGKSLAGAGAGAEAGKKVIHYLIAKKCI
jgi:hypothetical protein